MHSVLLIDDSEKVLDGLCGELRKLTSPEEVEIRRWLPTQQDGDPDVVFKSLVDDGTLLVATDYDLTSKGMKGLFGLTIVGWCQSRSIPVGDFSRGHMKDLPEEPNLFELRVPPDDVGGAQFIASALKGFRSIRSSFSDGPAFALDKSGSLATGIGRSARPPSPRRSVRALYVQARLIKFIPSAEITRLSDGERAAARR